MKRAGVVSLVLALLLSAPFASGCERSEPDPPRAAWAEARAARADAPRAEPLAHRVVGSGEGPWVVVLHGYGARGDDLVPLAERIARGAGVRCAVPEAPRRTAGGGRAWWPLDVAELREERARGVNRFAEAPPPGLDAARRRVIDLVDSLRQSSGAAVPIYLVGFSQGGMLAADVALRLDPPPAGVAVLSGTFLTVDEWTERMATRPSLDVVVAHGRRDEILPFASSRTLADAWAPHARSLRFVAFDGGHQIPPEAVAAVIDLVRPR